jgi:hypothetical protein
MFSATRYVFQAITKDANTDRIRSIQPDENVMSMWDDLEKIAESYNWSPSGSEGYLARHVHTEADVLEDTILFPKEASGEMANDLFSNHLSALDIFQSGGSLDARKIVKDFDTDCESMTSGEYEGHSDEENYSDTIKMPSPRLKPNLKTRTGAWTRKCRKWTRLVLPTRRCSPWNKLWR